MSNKLTLYVPIEKIDKEKRTVGGWATTEEIDKQDEIVDFNGSKKAFDDWQGNIREMHEPKAVGKAIEVLPNEDTKKIWVKAHISKGAEDTWEKIKDGTLTGFSIGGQTVHKTTQIIKDLANGSQRTITRITKYKLNELSLVDNPANVECSFSLVKNINGSLQQTEICEDIKKIIVTESEDPLKTEVTEHREKADALIRKVIDPEELDKLSDDDFGVIRKSIKGDVHTKERILPMPDKVHAVRALEIYKNYGLTEEEEKLVHKKAQEILGAAYENYNLNRGGEDTVSNEKLDKLTEIVGELAEQVGDLLKAFEGAYKPIPGAKKTPNDADTTPSLGESANLDGRESGDPEQEPITQDPKGAYPAKGPIKAADPGESNLETQGELAAPIKDGKSQGYNGSGYPKHVKKDGADSEGDKYPGKHVAETDLQTQDPDGAYPAKGPIKAEEVYEHESEETEEEREEENEEEEEEMAEKSTKSEDIKKAGTEKVVADLTKQVESLRKGFDEVLSRLKKPIPRKTKIEKNLSDNDADEAELQLQKRKDQITEWRKSGKALTTEQERFVDETVDISLARKVS